MRLVILFLCAVAFPLKAICEDHVLLVKGEAEIEVQPDIIKIGYSVVKTASDVSVSKEYVDRVSSDTIKAALAQGIKKEDISSSQLEIHREINYDKDDKPVMAGYTVSRSVTLILRNIQSYGALIQSLVDAKIDEIESVKPEISTFPKLKYEALKAASEDAKQKAEFLAAQFQGKCGDPIEVSEQGLGIGFQPDEIVVTARRAVSKSHQTPEIPYEFQPGKIKVTAKVTAKFRLVL